MSRNIRLLLLFCILAILGVLALQFFWIKNYYTITKVNFEREINLAFEDAIKKEFSLRCDTLQSLIEQQLMDSSKFTFSSKFQNKYKNYAYIITNAKNKKDLISFSSVNIQNVPYLPNDSSMRRKIASVYAEIIRDEDLNHHYYFYRTQRLGEFISTAVKKYDFDTARLRPVLQHYLLEKNIYTKFRFYLAANDSTLNTLPKHFPSQKQFPILSKSYPTYKWWEKEQQYVRAQFQNPVGYILSQLGWIFLSSILLILLVAFCIFLLFKALYREKHLSEIKNDFINNITHEFKTPIATISAAMEALSDFNVLPDKEKTKKYLSYSREELKRLTSMVNLILNISIYEKGKMEIHYEKIDVTNTIQEIISILHLFPGKKINFIMDNNIHPIILADKILFRQAVGNIIDNAIKYADDNPEIRIDYFEEKKHCILTISDNGWGISPQSLPLVYDRFFREHYSNHAVKGHGLGLSYVKSILEAHKGTIKIESIKGKGTKVYMSWPL